VHESPAVVTRVPRTPYHMQFQAEGRSQERSFRFPRRSSQSVTVWIRRSRGF
jgi:hypothetical protein